MWRTNQVTNTAREKQHTYISYSRAHELANIMKYEDVMSKLLSAAQLDDIRSGLQVADTKESADRESSGSPPSCKKETPKFICSNPLTTVISITITQLRQFLMQVFINYFSSSLSS